jgi:hypothetical protein
LLVILLLLLLLLVGVLLFSSSAILIEGDPVGRTPQGVTHRDVRLFWVVTHRVHHPRRHSVAQGAIRCFSALW